MNEHQQRQRQRTSRARSPSKASALGARGIDLVWIQQHVLRLVHDNAPNEAVEAEALRQISEALQERAEELV